MENIYLIGWVIINKNYLLEQLPKRDKVLNKITALCKDHNSWKNEDDILQLLRSDFKGNRFFPKGKVTLHTLSLLFDSDLKLVKEHLLNKYSNYNNVDNTHVRVKETLIRIQKDIERIHINFVVGYPTTD